MAITLKVSTEDPQAEEILLHLKEKFPALDNFDQRNILKRCVRWLEIIDESIFDEDNQKRVHLKIGLPVEDVLEESVTNVT